MGGHTDMVTAFNSTMENNPFCKFDQELFDWFLYTGGIYFSELINHLFFDKRKNDFIEMLVHHLATIFLVFGSAYAN